jgi:transposase
MVVFDYSGDMPRVAPAVSLDSNMKAILDQLVRSPSTSHGLVQRSRIVLAAAAGKSNQQIADELQMPEVTIGKWRRGFVKHGLEGLQDAPRSGRPVKHGPEVVQRVQNRACQQPEHYSRWSVRTLAQELNLPRSTVHQILVASHLQPHRIRTFTFSPDPDLRPSCWTLLACI